MINEFRVKVKFNSPTDLQKILAYRYKILIPRIENTEGIFQFWAKDSNEAEKYFVDACEYRGIKIISVHAHLHKFNDKDLLNVEQDSIDRALNELKK